MSTFAKRSMFGLAAVALLLMAAPAANATPFTLVDDNSTAQFDTQSSIGLYNWTVDGVDHAWQQWFWFRDGQMSDEASIDTLGGGIPALEGVTDTNFDGNPDTLYVKYLTPGYLQIETTFTLTGGSLGSKTSDIGEQIKITNMSPTDSLEFHFFQYTDLDLAGTAGDDTAALVNNQTVQQWDAFMQWAGSETVVTPLPDHYEIAFFPTTLLKFSDGLPTTLSDATSPLGPGDVTWAFQWDFTLAPGEAFQISKDKTIIPSPSAALLGVLGLSLALKLRRRV